MTANHTQAGYPSEDYGTTENFDLLEELQKKKEEIQQLYCLLQQEQAQNAFLRSTLGSQEISFNSMLQEKDKQLEEKDKQLKEKDRQLIEKDKQLEEMIRKLQETVKDQQELLRQLREKEKQRAERWNQIACSVRKDHELASGSWGVVYKGTLPVAIKELKNITPESLELFQHEVDIAFSCHHRNIVEFLGAATNVHSGPCIIVMELMDGNLRNFIKHKNYQLTQKAIISIALDVAKGLSYLHGHNPRPILHCDLKSDNILLKLREAAKIGDLGSAKVQQDNMTPYRGTLLYTAPEVLKANIQTPKMDVWSFGLVVLEMATGARPSPSQLSEQVQQITCPKLKELVAACTQIQPHQRPSMPAVVRFLHAPTVQASDLG